MMLENENNSLCETCNRKANCSHIAAIIGPVVCCEEFDDYTEKPGNAPTGLEPEFKKKPANGSEYLDGITGLCMDCEHVRSCETVKAGGAIWHCEEYK